MCGTAAGGFMCVIVQLTARPFMSWTDTTPAPNVKSAAMLPPRDSPVCAEAGPPMMAATNKSLAQSNKSRTGGEATKKRESSVSLQAKRDDKRRASGRSDLPSDDVGLHSRRCGLRDLVM